MRHQAPTRALLNPPTTRSALATTQHSNAPSHDSSPSRKWKDNTLRSYLYLARSYVTYLANTPLALQTAANLNHTGFYTKCTRFLHATRNASRVLRARCTSFLIAASLVRKQKTCWNCTTLSPESLTPCSMHEKP